MTDKTAAKQTGEIMKTEERKKKGRKSQLTQRKDKGDEQWKKSVNDTPTQEGPFQLYSFLSLHPSRLIPFYSLLPPRPLTQRQKTLDTVQIIFLTSAGAAGHES